MPYLSFSRILLPVLLISISALAHGELETKELGLIIRQIDSIGLLADRSKRATSPSGDPRYRFDYEQLAQDLRRVHLAIQDYLAPSRAQPNDPAELSGAYRRDVESPSATHEHD